MENNELNQLLHNLEKRGIRLSLEEGSLRLSAPKGTLTEELKTSISRLKPELLATLSGKNKKVSQTVDFSLFFFASDASVSKHDKYRLVLDAARFADQNGFKGIWTPERHFHEMGGIFPNPSVIAAALAAVTTKIKLRAGSVVLPLHDSIRVAEEWSVVDNLSGGRVELSFASGWHVNDFVLASENYTGRRQVMFDKAEEVRKLWRGEAITRKSGAGTQVQVFTRPEPVQNELPVWITAIGNPETYLQAARIGANLMTCLLDQDISELSEKIRLYRKELSENGFEPKASKVAVFLHTYIGTSGEQVKEKVYHPFREYLRTTLDLLGKLGESAGITINPGTMSSEDQETLLDFAFERYFSDRTMMGDLEICKNITEKLITAGVDEIACLVDFGLNNDDIMQSIIRLNQLRQMFSE